MNNRLLYSFFNDSNVKVLTFAIGLPNPMGAVGVHDTRQLASDQFVLGWALQGDDCAHTGTVALDDRLGAQGWQGDGCALSFGLT